MGGSSSSVPTFEAATHHQPRSEARPPQQTWPRSPADEDTMINADTRSEQYSAVQCNTVQYSAVHFNPTQSKTVLLWPLSPIQIIFYCRNKYIGTFVVWKKRIYVARVHSELQWRGVDTVRYLVVSLLFTGVSIDNHRPGCC